MKNDQACDGAQESEQAGPSPIKFNVETKTMIVPAGSHAVNLKFSTKIGSDYLFA